MIYAPQYKCDECGKTFVVEWRLKKHQILHQESASIKYCHYFNNKKDCPYDNIGCMFRHTESNECKFGGKCRIKLCQFQHNAVEETAEQIDNLKCEMCHFETSLGQKLNEHKESIHQYEKFDALEEWEKYEVNDYMCDNICWQGDHKCFEKEEENDLIGVDVKKIKEDFRNCVYEERYKCEMCNYQSKTMKQVNTHF